MEGMRAKFVGVKGYRSQVWTSVSIWEDVATTGFSDDIVDVHHNTASLLFDPTVECWR